MYTKLKIFTMDSSYHIMFTLLEKSFDDQYLE